MPLEPSRRGQQATVGEETILGRWEGAHPVRDGTISDYRKAKQGEFKYMGVLEVVGSDLASARWSVGETCIWLNPTGGSR